MTVGALRSKSTQSRKTTSGSTTGAISAQAPKLDALTSLRFFCAAGIVYLHGDGLFNVYWGNIRIEWSQFLSCFFVLSGFILSYVYPKLDSINNCRHFLRARLARVYPATFVAMLIPFAIGLTQCGTTPDFAKVLLANIFLIQGWIPQAHYYFSINAPAWSISTEFFFYLMFLLLIQNLKSTWAWKLLVAAGVTVGCILASAALNLPDDGGPFQVTSVAMIYINPLSRTFEFVVGMVAGVVWQELRKRQISSTVVSLAEIVFIAAIAFYMCNASAWLAPLSDQDALARAIRIWLLYSGNCFFFAGLIACLALQRGVVSKFLSHKTLVWLGEISFATYLLHIFGRDYYHKFQAQFSDLNNWFCFAVYIGVLLIASHLMYEFVETPLRSLIARGRLPGKNKNFDADQGAPTTAKKQLLTAQQCIALCEVAILVLTFVGIKYHIKMRNRTAGLNQAPGPTALLHRSPPVAR